MKIFLYILNIVVFALSSAANWLMENFTISDHLWIQVGVILGCGIVYGFSIGLYNDFS